MRNRNRYNAPFMTIARHAGWVCAETGAKIKKGDPIAYFPNGQKAYSENSKAAEDVRALEFSRAFNMGDSDY